jgi:hypothetical protein
MYVKRISQSSVSVYALNNMAIKCNLKISVNKKKTIYVLTDESEKWTISPSKKAKQLI